MASLLSPIQGCHGMSSTAAVAVITANKPWRAAWVQAVRQFKSLPMIATIQGAAVSHCVFFLPDCATVDKDHPPCVHNPRGHPSDVLSSRILQGCCNACYGELCCNVGALYAADENHMVVKIPDAVLVKLLCLNVNFTLNCDLISQGNELRSFVVLQRVSCG